jgi:hypothetical protein
MWTAYAFALQRMLLRTFLGLKKPTIKCQSPHQKRSYSHLMCFWSKDAIYLKRKQWNCHNCFYCLISYMQVDVLRSEINDFHEIRTPLCFSDMDDPVRFRKPSIRSLKITTPCHQCLHLKYQCSIKNQPSRQSNKLSWQPRSPYNNL